MKKLRCAVLGATGMVGKIFLRILSNHPWIDVQIIAASSKSEGKRLRRFLTSDEDKKGIDDRVLNMVVQNVNQVEEISEKVDFVFCALDMPKDEIIALEEAYACREVVVISNNSALRWYEDVPMIVPEINGISHLKALDIQKKRLGTKYGCIVVKPNCVAQSYMIILDALSRIYKRSISVVLMQAISGSGKHLEDVPETHGTIVPLFNEAYKSQMEPKKIFGRIEDGKIVNSETLHILVSSYRVPIENGHTSVVSIQSGNVDVDTFSDIRCALTYYNPLSRLDLPSSPTQLIISLEDNKYPSPEDLNNFTGMEIFYGGLKVDKKSSLIQLISLSHNLIRGAAGGAVLTAELMIKLGYIKN